MRRNRSVSFLRLGFLLAVGCSFAPSRLHAAKTDQPPAKVTVDGAGLLRDREFRLALNRLLDVSGRPSLDANAIEDAAVILSSSLGEEGFQNPQIEIEATLVDGSHANQVFDPTFAVPLPRPLEAREVKFKIKTGVRYHIDTVEFTGLTVLSPKAARAFFRSDSTLLATARTNAYAPSRLSRGADALLSELRQRGYAEAEVRFEKQTDEKSGKVAVMVDVKQGPRWEVRTVMYQRTEDDTVELPHTEVWVAQPWSSTLHDTIREAIRQAYYGRGYPDVGVNVGAEAEQAEEGRK